MVAGTSVAQLAARATRSAPAKDDSRAAAVRATREAEAQDGQRFQPARPSLVQSEPATEPTRRALSATASLQALNLQGPAVNLRRSGAHSGRALVVKASILTFVMVLALSVISFGTLPIILLGYWLFDLCKRWSTVRAIQSSAVPVSPAQLPDLHRCIKQLGLRLSLRETPRLYVTAGVRTGITSITFGGELTILLPTEVLAEQLERDSPHVLSFILSHEVARHALGHHGRLRTFLAWIWPAVRKLQVLSADEITAELMVDRSSAQSALLTMLVGPRVATLLDRTELDRQATSHERESLFYAPALEGKSEFLLARLHHLAHPAKA